MNSFQFFDLSDYGIVLLLLLIATYILIRLIKRTKLQITENQKNIVKRKGLISILVGDICIIISVVGFILLERDHQRVIGFLRPISIMTSEPIVFLLIVFFIMGIVLDIMGIYCLRSSYSKNLPYV